MKFVLASLIVLSSLAAHAGVIKSSDKKVSIARVVQVIPLVQKYGLQVSVAVQDLGGSTDVSSTQLVYLNLYSKGEMFSTDATFEIADVLKLRSAKRISGGIYEIVVEKYDSTYDLVTYTIDAQKAVTEIQAVKCDDFDCDASSNFSTTINVSEKRKEIKF